MFDASHLYTLANRLLSDRPLAARLESDTEGIVMDVQDGGVAHLRLVSQSVTGDDGVPFQAVEITRQKHCAILYLHSDDIHALTRCVTVSLNVAHSMISTRAAGLYECPWCALPIPDQSGEGVAQAQAECQACKFPPDAA